MNAKEARAATDATNAIEAASEYKSVIEAVKKTAAEGGNTVIAKGLKQGDNVTKLLTADGYGIKWSPELSDQGPVLTVRW